MIKNELKAKRIWCKGLVGDDSYAEFIGSFQTSGDEKIILKIACDSMYAVYLNGELSCFGQCSDYPYYKYFDTVDISKESSAYTDVKIIVWYTGYDCLTYIKGEPMLAFSIEQDGKVLLSSDKKVLSRQNINYKNGFCKPITTQLGYGFYYDNTVENTLPYAESVEMEGETEFHYRPIENLRLEPRCPYTVTEQETGYLLDFGRETVGFLDVDFESDSEQEIIFVYGEHQENGVVPRKIDYRDFGLFFKAKRGKNVYLNAFRRLAGRYIQIFCKDKIKINYVGIRPTVRKVERVKRKFASPLIENVYNVGVDTLFSCMHEHYEDCPWREQALYNLDSRNQMLCGYYAFKGYDFQRYNLVLMSHGYRTSSGLLALCYPSKSMRSIPFFNLLYILQVCEYIEHTGDVKILDEIGDTLQEIISLFSSRIDQTGLIPNFPLPCWNYYEWTEKSNGSYDTLPRKGNLYDLILNCTYVYVCEKMNNFFHLEFKTEKIRRAIQRTFYDDEKGLYFCNTQEKFYSQLGNSMAILIDLADESVAKKIIEDKSVVKISFAANTFFYDALLKFGDKYKEFIIRDIESKYKPMLDAGATSFWETEEGSKAFDGAGSLCHGWSAIPVYYYSILGVANTL